MGIRSKFPALAAGLAILVSGCVYSEKGIALPDRDDSLFETSLLGEWKEKILPWSAFPEGPPRRWRIERQAPGSNRYSILGLTATRPDDSVNSLKDVRLFRLGDNLFLDCPLSDPVALTVAGVEVPTIHIISRLRIRENQFVMDELDVDFLKRHPASVPHQIKGRFKGQVRLTESPEGFRAFLVENAKNEAAWSKSSLKWFVKVMPSGQASSAK